MKCCRNNKKWVYTCLSIIFAFVFIFGSMAVMNMILRMREKQLLSESGSAVAESPVKAWEEGNQSNQDTASVPYTLTASQTEDAISNWNERADVVMHNPVSGQIDMEQAIKAGQTWLVKMGYKEKDDKKGEIYSVHAVLSTTKQNEKKKEPLEPYYSFWTVHFSNPSMGVLLYINAVTGKVWNARVCICKNMPKKIPYKKLKRFMKLSGIKLSKTRLYHDESCAILESDSNPIYVLMWFSDKQSGYYDSVSYSEIELMQYGDQLMCDEYVLIQYELMVKQTAASAAFGVDSNVNVAN